MDRETRDGMMAEYFRLHRREEELAEKIGEGGEGFEELDLIAECKEKIRAAYQEGLHAARASRCPFTGGEAVIGWDPYGVDGLFWDRENPERHDDELPPAFFALSGSVALADDPETAPFLVMPGPGVPALIREYIELPAVRAVISELPLGRHRAFAVFYYADPQPYGEADLYNEWGACPGFRRRSAGRELLDSDYDFDLEPWIDDKKLFWIAPGDDSLALRDGAAGCPYLGLAGPRSEQYLCDGRYWTGESLDAEFSPGTPDAEEIPPGAFPETPARKERWRPTFLTLLAFVCAFFSLGAGALLGEAVQPEPGGVMVLITMAGGVAGYFIAQEVTKTAASAVLWLAVMVACINFLDMGPDRSRPALGPALGLWAALLGAYYFLKLVHRGMGAGD